MRFAMNCDRCTLGEISSALESSWGRHRPSTAVVRGAYTASYNEPEEVSSVRTQDNGFEENVLLCCSELVESTCKYVGICVFITHIT